ncbi:MAG: TIGR04086 family membrane protein [Bacillota bacterium]
MNRQPGYSVAPQPLTGHGLFMVLLKGIALALALSALLLFIAALVLYFTAVPEKITPYLVFGVSLTAIMSGACFAGKRIGYRGWLYGGVVGFIYVALMLVIGLFALDNITVGWNLLSKLFLGFVFGATGGMWGVNR